MTLLAFLSLVVQMHIALTVSYFLFSALFKTAKRLGAHRDFALWRRIAQTLLLVSLIAPPLLAMIPRRTLPELSFRILNQDPDTGHIAARSRSRKLLSPRPQAPLSQPEEMPAQPFDPEKTVWLICFAILVAGIARLRKSWQGLRSVREILSRSIQIRVVGNVVITLSETARVPFSIRLAKAWVVVPLSMVGSTRDFRIAVQHEIQHHRQGDTLCAWLIEALQCWFGFNPFFGRWKKRITELQEFSCDEALLLRKGISSMDYGSCLLRVAEAALNSREMHVGTACMAAGFENPEDNRSFLMRRIEMLMHARAGRATRSARFILGTSSLLVLVATVAFAYGAQQTLRSDHLDALNPGVAKFNPRVQEITEGVLKKHLELKDAASGFAVVADPRTGEVLAFANIIRQGEPKGGNWALSERVEPASLMKGLVIASAISEKKALLAEKFDCMMGNYRVGNHVHHDYKPFDQLSAEETVTLSSNICGIRVAERLGPEGLDRALGNFGLGAGGSASEFPEARSGFLPQVDLTEGSQYLPLLASGHSNVRVTALEIVQAYGAIANGGMLLKPRRYGSGGDAIAIRRVMDAESASSMKGVLVNVVNKGTGASARSDLYTTAGKTGTAFGMSPDDQEMSENQGRIAHFVGFAPVSNPRVVIYVVMSVRPPELAHGGTFSAPAFKEIAERVLQSMNVAPDKAGR